MSAGIFSKNIRPIRNVISTRSLLLELLKQSEMYSNGARQFSVTTLLEPLSITLCSGYPQQGSRFNKPFSRSVMQPANLSVSQYVRHKTPNALRHENCTQYAASGTVKEPSAINRRCGRTNSLDCSSDGGAGEEGGGNGCL